MINLLLQEIEEGKNTHLPELEYEGETNGIEEDCKCSHMESSVHQLLSHIERSDRSLNQDGMDGEGVLSRHTYIQRREHFEKERKMMKRESDR